jgi:hypothetical protein
LKRPGSLAWSRRAVESALDQALRYAAEQRVKAVAICDGPMLYSADITQGGLRDRVFVSLCECEAPLDLWWMAVQGIWRELSNFRGVKVSGIPEDAILAVLQRLARAARQAGHMLIFAPKNVSQLTLGSNKSGDAPTETTFQANSSSTSIVRGRKQCLHSESIRTRNLSPRRRPQHLFFLVRN